MLQIEGPKQPRDSAPADRVEDLPPPPLVDNADTADKSKSEQQKAAQQDYKERMKAKGYAPTKSRGKKPSNGATSAVIVL